MHALQYLSVLIATSVVSAQDDSAGLSALVSALEGLGLTGLRDAAASVAGTEEGAAILQALTSGNNYTVFAPSNQAFEAVPSDVSSNDTLLASLLSYHILPGDYEGIAYDFPNVTVARTLLNQSSGLVNLEGDQNQVLAWTLIDGQGTLLNQGNGSNVTVTNSTTLGSIVINQIDSVLQPPPALDVVLTNPRLNLSSLVEVLGGLASEAGEDNPFASGSVLKGFTLFAPNNAAFQAAMSAIPNNNSVVIDVLRNHLLNGTTVYSPQVAVENAPEVVTSGGQPMTFTTNSTGTFVTVGNNATARIVESDVLVENGVVHVIDQVLLDTNVDEQAADEAASSAASVADGFSTMPTQTGPIGQPTGGAGNGGDGGDDNGDDTGNAVVFLPSALVSLGVAAGIAFAMA